MHSMFHRMRTLAFLVVFLHFGILHGWPLPYAPGHPVFGFEPDRELSYSLPFDPVATKKINKMRFSMNVFQIVRSGQKRGFQMNKWYDLQNAGQNVCKGTQLNFKVIGLMNKLRDTLGRNVEFATIRLKVEDRTDVAHPKVFVSDYVNINSHSVESQPKYVGAQPKIWDLDDVVTAWKHGSDRGRSIANKQSIRSPTKLPTESPTKYPTKSPTKLPTKSPSELPTQKPTGFPSKYPSRSPTKSPTKLPSKYPTHFPSKSPTKLPSTYPTTKPTIRPTTRPKTMSPTVSPTERISAFPTWKPTNSPLQDVSPDPDESSVNSGDNTTLLDPNIIPKSRGIGEIESPFAISLQDSSIKTDDLQKAATEHDSVDDDCVFCDLYTGHKICVIAVILFVLAVIVMIGIKIRMNRKREHLYRNTRNMTSNIFPKPITLSLEDEECDDGDHCNEMANRREMDAEKITDGNTADGSQYLRTRSMSTGDLRAYEEWLTDTL